MCTEMSVHNASIIHTGLSVYSIQSGKGVSPRCLRIIERRGHVTATPPAVRDRFCDGKAEFTWSDMQALVSRTGASLMAVAHPPLELRRLERSNCKKTM
jgi:hypothetical protein